MTSFSLNNNYIEKEKYYGNVEYKLKFIHMNESKIKKYATQMKFRLIEGNGEAVYLIGVQDNGQIVGLDDEDILQSKKFIFEIAREINSVISNFVTLNVENSKRKILMANIKANFNLDEIFLLHDDL